MRNFVLKSEASTAASDGLPAGAANSGSRLVALSFGLLLLLALSFWFGIRGTGAADAAESYPGKGFLPDNRAWELVSPPDKNGGEVMPYSANAKAAVDCSSDCRVSFASLSGFAGVRGFSNSNTQYISRRAGDAGTPGWSTYGITPPQPPPPLVTLTSRVGYVGDLSDDLSRGALLTIGGISTVDGDHPNVKSAKNAYLRTDLDVPGDGAYHLLSDSPIVQPFSGQMPSYFATNDSFTTVAYEANNQRADATGSGRKLIAYSNGESHAVENVPNPTDARCGGAGPSCITETTSAMSGVVSGPWVSAPEREFNPYAVDSQRVVSDDGNRVFYRAPIDTNSGEAVANSRLYMRDDQGTAQQSDDTFTRIQQSEKTTPEAPVSAKFWYATKNGDEAYFSTTEGLVDGDNNASEDIYRYTDSADPQVDSNLTRISVDQEGADAPDVEAVLQISENGEYVYFVAGGDLVPGQDHNASGNGLYLWHDGEITFLGEFLDGSVDWVPNSPRSRLTQDKFFSSRIAENGDLLFTSADPSGFPGFEDFDSNGKDVMIVYSPASDHFQCASCNPSGQPPASPAWIMSTDGLGGSTYPSDPHLPSALSSDGRFVFFSTGDSLVPEDVNGPCVVQTFGFQDSSGRRGDCADAYVYDTETERAHLLSSGTGAQGSYFMDASDDGSDVFIATREQLSAWDTDGAYDLYDARIGGGFPEPLIEEPCTSADDCRGESSGTPADDNPGSVANESDGNAAGAPPPDCTKKQNKLDKAERKLRKAKKKAKKAHGKKAKKRAKKAKKRAKNKVKKAERKLERCRGGNS